jgi:hypothetical protein
MMAASRLIIAWRKKPDWVKPVAAMISPMNSRLRAAKVCGGVRRNGMVSGLSLAVFRK